VTVDGQPVVPIDFSVAHILSQRDRLLAEAGITGAAGCLKIVVGGIQDGAEHTYVFSLSSTSVGAGEGTGIPAGLAALLMHRGSISGAGVHPPEAVVDPVQMLALAGDVLDRLGVDAGGEAGHVPIHIEHIGPDGSVDELSLAL
jgi:saccharopine dehydrogenase-like NADP-dependent oxidoreductase